MWETLGSPPQNFRFYRFSDNSNQKEEGFRKIDLEDHKANLFQNEKLSSVAQESISKINAQCLSQNTNKPISSLKSTSKVNSKANNERSLYDLKMNCKNNNSKIQSKSLLEHVTKQKSSLLLSHKQKSSVIQQQSSRKGSKKENKSHQQSHSHFTHSQKESYMQSINNQEQDQFSQIFIKEINKTEEQLRKGHMFKDKQKGQIFIKTLLEIRDLQKQQLTYQKRLLKLAEEKGQISFLYDKEDKEQNKFYRNKKQNRKSFKRTQQKSTVKKLGKSIAFEQRLSKVQQKCRDLQKKLDMQNGRRTPTMSRNKKKSMSTLR